MKQVPIRLALRHEGPWWVAYLAQLNTMKGAKELGRIKIELVENPKYKQVFLDLMQEIVGDAIKTVTGQEPSWPEPQEAPESEKSGHA